MQFNISMDSHYGWIRSEIVASFFCKAAGVRTVLFYSRQRAIYHREGGFPLPVTSLQRHHITQAS
jgi:hypothetical protein